MSEMIERVAKAIEQAPIRLAGELNGKEVWLTLYHYIEDGLDDEDFEAFNADNVDEIFTAIVKHLTDAALKAIKDPTEGQVKAGVTFAQGVSLSGEYTWPEYIEDLFKVMMDASVEEIK